ncbi:MAG: helix-turn-helix domain-containing protein [Acidimicrobiales bacterium]
MSLKARGAVAPKPDGRGGRTVSSAAVADLANRAGQGSAQSRPERRAQLLLTTDEAAGYLNVSARTVKNLMCDGRIAYVKIGRATRIQVTDLDDYVARNRRRHRTRTGPVTTRG